MDNVKEKIVRESPPELLESVSRWRDVLEGSNKEMAFELLALPLIGWVTFISPLPQDKDSVLQGGSRLHWQTAFCCGNLYCAP